MTGRLIQAIKPQVNEGQNEADLQKWAMREAHIIESFAFNEAKREKLFEASLRDALERIGKGLYL